MLSFLVLGVAAGMFLAAVGVVVHDLFGMGRYRRATPAAIVTSPEAERMRWRTTIALLVLAWVPLLAAIVSPLSLMSHQ